MSDNSNVAESIEEARARADLDLGKALLDALHDGRPEDEKRVLSQALNTLNKLRREAGRPALTDISGLASEAADQIQAREEVEALGSMTLGRLLATEFPPTRWAVPSLLPEGLALLGGRPKIGKSWLAVAMAIDVAAGTQVLDQFPPAPGDVLLIAYEDSKQRLQDRLIKVGAGDLDGESLERLHIETEWPTMPNGGLDKLGAWLTSHPETRLVIVDTFQRFRSDGANGNRDRYAHDYQFAAELQAIALRAGVCVLCLHHLRKATADDWTDQLSGTAGITGGADTLLGVFRERGAADATLRVTGRDVAENDWAISFDGARWRTLGYAAEYRIGQARRRILELVQDAGRIRTGELANLTNTTPANCAQHLKALLEDGLVHTPERGVWEPAPRQPELPDPM